MSLFLMLSYAMLAMWLFLPQFLFNLNNSVMVTPHATPKEKDMDKSYEEMQNRLL